MSAVASVVGTLNPFPGLRPFREDEQKLFFGREAQVDRMVDKLAANRFLAVVGSSGSGKSSLVNCGLKPALRRGLLTSAGSSWRMIQFRPGANPNHALACALVDDGSIIPTFGSGPPRPELIEATLGLSGFGLVDLCKHSRLEPETNLLVVVDQFEELFRYRSLSAGAGGYGHGPEAIRFVRLLLDSARQKEVPIYVVLTMRSDFLGDCAQFDGLAEAISEGQYLVPRMTRDERRAAVEGPIRVVDCTISTALLTTLLNDAGDNPDQLSIQQHAMNRTWARWRHEGRVEGPITADDYEAVGRMDMALHRHAEKAYSELTTDRQRLICQRVFKALTDRGTDPRGIRRPTRLTSLREIVGATQDEVMEVLRPFRKTSRSFLLPAEGDKIDDSSVIDISHESLMRVWVKLSLWADEEAETAREYRRLLDRAEDHRLMKGGLMQGPDLQTALDFRARQQPTPAWASLYGGKFELAMEYLCASEEQRLLERADKELERRWQSLWQPAILSVAALAFVIVLLKFQDKLLPQHRGFGYTKWQAIAGETADAVVKKDLLRDVIVPFFKIGGLLAGLTAICWFALRLGRSLHRRYALPAILCALRNPLPSAPAVEQQAQDPATISGTIYASGWRRTRAFLIDFVIGLVFLAVSIAVAMSLLLAIVNQPDSIVTPAVYSTLFGGWFLLLCAYHVLTDGSRRQASWGMRAARIYVTDSNGCRLSRRAIAKRQVVKLIWFTLTCFLAAVPLLVFLVTYLVARRYNPESPIVRMRQWPHDLVCKTVVLVGRPPRAGSTAAAIVGSAPDAWPVPAR